MEVIHSGAPHHPTCNSVHVHAGRSMTLLGLTAARLSALLVWELLPDCSSCTPSLVMAQSTPCGGSAGPPLPPSIDALRLRRLVSTVAPACTTLSRPSTQSRSHAGFMYTMREAALLREKRRAPSPLRLSQTWPVSRASSLAAFAPLVPPDCVASPLLVPSIGAIRESTGIGMGA